MGFFCRKGIFFLLSFYIVQIFLWVWSIQLIIVSCYKVNELPVPFFLDCHHFLEIFVFELLLRYRSKTEWNQQNREMNVFIISMICDFHTHIWTSMCDVYECVCVNFSIEFGFNKLQRKFRQSCFHSFACHRCHLINFHHITLNHN